MIRFTGQSFQNFGVYHRLCLSRQEATQIFLISNGIAMAESSVVEEVAVLFHAALIGRSDVIKTAISEIHSRCSEEETVALISSGRIEDGATPLHLAALAGHADVVRYLLNVNADLDVAPNLGTIFFNKRPYDVAVDSAKQQFHVYMFEQIAKGRVQSIDRLLRGGVPVTVRDGFKLDESTLHWACSFNDIEVAKLLLLWGIPVDTTNKDGQTALHLACKTVNIGMIKLLLSEGASVAATDSSGNMPKSLLLESNEEIESLLNNPPEPTFALQNMFHKSQLALDSATAAEQSVKEIAIPPIAVSAADQLLGTSSNGKHSTSNGSSSGLTYSDRDGQDYGDKGKTEPDNHKESPLLVLWPPAKRQARRGQETLDLNSRDTLLIHVACEVMDILPILGRSGLIDVLEQFNFRTSVKRPASDNAGADVAGVAPARAAAPAIRFCVDSGLCPGRHRFEIEVCLQYISVLASDRQGGLYGLYALGQLLQLHSEVTYSEEGDVLLAIPAISLSDWPDVMNRAVMWSFRDRARGSFQVMRETFELLSRLRVDMVLLVIDTTSVKDAMEQEKVENDMRNVQVGSKAQIDSDKSLLKAENEESEKMTATYITALDEICEGVCVELVPTVSITSVTQRLSLSLLKSFSNTMMCVMFNFDLQSVRNDLREQRLNEEIEGEEEEEEGGGGGGGVVTDAECNDACIAACEAAFHTASLIGYTAIIYSCTKWVRTVANPRLIGISKGLNAVERSADHLCPPSLILKPIYFAQDYIRCLQESSRRVSRDGLSMSVLPAFLDSDFMTPILSLKYYCFLFAGFAWNREALGDMVLLPPNGINIPDASILKEVVGLLLFSKGMSNSNETHMEWTNAVMSTFAGELLFSHADGRARGSSVTSQRGERSLSGSFTEDALPTASALVNAEKHLWVLLNSPVSVFDSPCPSKGEASHLLKQYRRFLTDSKWRVTPAKSEGLLSAFAFGSRKPTDETPFEQELDAFFSTIQVLCVFCRAVVLAHNAHDKLKSVVRSDATLGRLMQGLPLGIKSDIANALLAALGHCAVSAKRRFKNLQVDIPFGLNDLSAGSSDRDRDSNSVTSLFPLLPVPSIPVSREGSRGNLTHGPIHPTHAARVRYLRQTGPALPALAVMKTISDQLPIPQSIEETLFTIFS